MESILDQRVEGVEAEVLRQPAQRGEPVTALRVLGLDLFQHLQHATRVAEAGHFGQALQRLPRRPLAGRGQQTLLERTITLARLRPLPAADRGEFGWTLRSQDDPLPAAQLARMLGDVGISWVKLPVWFDAAEMARGESIATFAEQLSLEGIELVGVLDQPPAELRDAFREKGRLPVASVFMRSG